MSVDVEPTAQEYDDALQLKTEGNAAFKKKDFDMALKCYCRMFIHLGTVWRGEKVSKGPLAVKTDELRAFAYNNIAAVYAARGLWENCKEKCDKLLKYYPKNVKALIRRARANRNLNLIELAEADLETLSELEDPKVAKKAVAIEKNLCKGAKKEAGKSMISEMPKDKTEKKQCADDSVVGTEKKLVKKDYNSMLSVMAKEKKMKQMSEASKRQREEVGYGLSVSAIQTVIADFSRRFDIRKVSTFLCNWMFAVAMAASSCFVPFQLWVCDCLLCGGDLFFFFKTKAVSVLKTMQAMYCAHSARAMAPMKMEKLLMGAVLGDAKLAREGDGHSADEEILRCKDHREDVAKAANVFVGSGTVKGKGKEESKRIRLRERRRRKRFRKARNKRFPLLCADEIVQNPYAVGDRIALEDSHTGVWNAVAVVDKHNNWVVLRFDDSSAKSDERVHVLEMKHRLRSLESSLSDAVIASECDIKEESCEDQVEGEGEREPEPGAGERVAVGGHFQGEHIAAEAFADGFVARFCTGCGIRTNTQWKFCPSCGTRTILEGCQCG